uniref:HNH endonuclease n=1 Tax=viral metagenome TaxID=1070528 RepID=A0A6M3LL27_9ZZZZ
MNNVSINNRRRSVILHDFKYNKIKGSFCIYCGEKAHVYDHVPPISKAEQFKGTFIKVPSCKSCNAILNNTSFKTLKERREHLIKKLSNRKDLKIPIWDYSELSELEGFIKKYIKKGIKNREVLKKRLTYLYFYLETENFEDYYPYDDFILLEDAE